MGVRWRLSVVDWTSTSEKVQQKPFREVQS